MRAYIFPLKRMVGGDHPYESRARNCVFCYWIPIVGQSGPFAGAYPLLPAPASDLVNPSGRSIYPPIFPVHSGGEPVPPFALKFIV